MAAFKGLVVLGICGMAACFLDTRHLVERASIEVQISNIHADAVQMSVQVEDSADVRHERFPPAQDSVSVLITDVAVGAATVDIRVYNGASQLLQCFKEPVNITERTTSLHADLVDTSDCTEPPEDDTDDEECVATVAIEEDELCHDGIDNDCNGQTDCEDPNCMGAIRACLVEHCSGTQVCQASGWGTCSIAPIPENNLALCHDGEDNDCDGKIDCEDSSCQNCASCGC